MKKSSTSIHVVETNDDEFTVRLRSANSDTFRDLISELKESVPPHSRIYQPTLKAWTVYGRENLDQWLNYAREMGATIEWGSEEAPTRMSPSHAYKTLHLLPNAPPGVIRAAYKALATIHHPDKGGDLERMKVINAAHDLLMREVRI